MEGLGISLNSGDIMDDFTYPAEQLNGPQNSPVLIIIEHQVLAPGVLADPGQLHVRQRDDLVGRVDR